MKIDTSRIEGYADMSTEDKLKALEGFEYEDNAAELSRQKNAISKANSDAAQWKKKYNEMLSEDERKKQEQADSIAAMDGDVVYRNVVKKNKEVVRATGKSPLFA